MSDPYVQKLDTVVDIHGRALEVGVNYDAVTVGVYDFSSTQYEELSHLLVQAAWQAAANGERMRREADGGCGWKQVGPCVYCADHGVRLYQGDLPDSKRVVPICAPDAHEWDPEMGAGFYGQCLICGLNEWYE